jgi:hypothetical protein
MPDQERDIQEEIDDIGQRSSRDDRGRFRSLPPAAQLDATAGQRHVGYDQQPSAALLPDVDGVAPKLATGDPDGAAHTLRRQIEQAIDDVVAYHLNELDQLVERILQIKDQIKQGAEIMKREHGNYFAFSAETSAFVAQVDARLREIINGGDGG